MRWRTRGLEDVIRIAEELEVHGVLKRIATEPMEAKALEDVDPTLGHGHSIVDRVDVSLAERVIRPLSDAATAGVERGIYVDGDAVDVIRDFVVVVGVPISETREAPGLIGSVCALLSNLLLDTGEDGENPFIQTDSEPHELRHFRIMGWAPFVPVSSSKTFEVAILFRAVFYGLFVKLHPSLAFFARHSSFDHEVRSDEEFLRFLVLALGPVLWIGRNFLWDGGEAGAPSHLRARVVGEEPDGEKERQGAQEND